MGVCRVCMRVCVCHLHSLIVGFKEKKNKEKKKKRKEKELYEDERMSKH